MKEGRKKEIPRCRRFFFTEQRNVLWFDRLFSFGSAAGSPGGKVLASGKDFMYFNVQNIIVMFIYYFFFITHIFLSCTAYLRHQRVYVEAPGWGLRTSDLLCVRGFLSFSCTRLLQGIFRTLSHTEQRCSVSLDWQGAKSQSHHCCLFKHALTVTSGDTTLTALDFKSVSFVRRPHPLVCVLRCLFRLLERGDGLHSNVHSLEYFFSWLICPEREPARPVDLRQAVGLPVRRSLDSPVLTQLPDKHLHGSMGWFIQNNLVAVQKVQS